MSTNTAELAEITETLSRPPRKGWLKLTLFLLSLGFSVAAFLAFDWVYSAAIKRASEAKAQPNLCRIPDPIRHHALTANCASSVQWGRNSYEFVTNSLGFRDEKIREIPLADSKPRVLLLGDSFTEGTLPWRDTYAARIAVSLPQYDFLDGGVAAYAPSVYLNVARMVLGAGYDIDEVIAFIDNSGAHYEAAFYRDIDGSGAVTGPQREYRKVSPMAEWHLRIERHLFATADIIDFLEQQLVSHGYYHLPMTLMAANAFDVEWAAWTYREVNETDAFPTGYAPLGLEAGLAREKAKMDLLWQELEERHIPLTVVVYPYPGQLVHDTAESRQVGIWREWCQGKCKRFVSLFPAFFAAKDECPRVQPGCWYSKLFLFGDIHYSGAGNALVADAIVKSLTETPPVKRLETSPAKSGQALGNR